MLQLYFHKEIDIWKVGRKSVARSRKKQTVGPKKEVRVPIQNNVFINPNWKLSSKRSNYGGNPKTVCTNGTFQDKFIEGLFQGMLNVNPAAPPHDLIQVLNREWNNLDDETVITVLSKCDARVSVCYGCSLNFERNRQGPLPPFAFIIVKKLRRKYDNQRMKYLAAPPNAFFHAFLW